MRIVTLVGLAAIVLALPTLSAAADPVATTGPTSAVGPTSATVTGTVAPGGESTSWYVEWGTTTAYGSKTTTKNAGNGTAPVDVSAQLTGLQTGVTYHYRLVASNADGTSQGADASFRTSSAPVATTGSASGIGPTHAVLSGTVDPNGLATTWYVEYGKTTSYGTRTTSRDAGSGSSPVAVSVNVTGLEPGASYHFRVVATSDAGTSRGSDRTFRSDPPPTVSTGSAGSIGPTSARVTGSVNPNNRQSVAWFEYGTSSRYGSRTPERPVGGGTTATTFSETLSGLQPGTTIHYRIAARSDAGTVFGRDRSFSTSAGPTVATGPATEIGATTANANGSVNPNGRSTSWWFEYGTTTRYGSRTPASPAGSGRGTVPVQVRLSSLPVASEIHYRLVAESSGGRVYGADVSFRTNGPPTVTTGVVTGLGISRAVVSGTVNPHGVSTKWWVELGRTPSLGARTTDVLIGSETSPVSVSRQLEGLTPGVRWWFRVVAESAGGRTTGAIASFATAPVPRDSARRPVRCTIVGTVGPDVLRGTPGRDVICGLGGNDRIAGLGGNDRIYAGPGNDRVEGGGGADLVEGGAGRDLLLGGSGDDVLRGGDGNDELLGGTGRDRLAGGGGSDSIAARDGVRDVVDGGPGSDAAATDLVDRRISIERRLRL